MSVSLILSFTQLIYSDPRGVKKYTLNEVF